MGFVKLFCKKNVQDAYSPKIRIQNIRAVKTGENKANLKFDKCHVFAWAFTMPPFSIKMALLVMCFMSLKLLEIEIIEVKIEWN